MSQRGCRVTVLAPAKAGARDTDGPYAVRWFPWAGSSKALVDFKLSSPADLRRTGSLLRSGERALRRLIVEEKTNTCLAMWVIPAGFVAWRVRSLAPYSVWALGSDIHTWAKRPIVGRLIRTVITGASRRFADGIELGAEVERISGMNCQFLPTSRRLPKPAPLPHPLGSGVNFLFVGRLESVKGADVLVEAMIRVLSGGIDARLTMCGAGTMDGLLRRRVESVGLGDRITIMPAQPAAVVAGYMHACDCLVVPSRMESIPLVFSEAFQAGIPLLVTDVGDMGVLARRHGLARPVPPADPDALSSAIQDFVRRLDEQRRGFARARQSLMSIFDIDAAAERYLTAIESPR